jgi:lysophospholipase L1-like esterase
MTGNEKKRNLIAFLGDSLTEGFPGVSYLKILKKRLPKDDLFNFGKGGDTVISLFKRINELHFENKFDLSFLWVGTNDVLVKVDKIYPIIKTMMKQPWVKDRAEFQKYYRQTLEFLLQYSQKIITVSPLFLGEDLNNPWNKQLEKFSQIIAEESSRFENVFHINLRDYFSVKISSANQEYYVIRPIRVALDVLLLKDEEKVDKKSLERGFYYTLDGVHLNSRGAQLIADIFQEQINKHLESHPEN